MTVLVTGAAGVSGTALLAILERSNAGDTTIHTSDLRDIPRELHVPCDMTSPAAVLDLVRSTRPDRVYHLAGTFTNRFETDHACNVLATRALLEAIRAEVPRCRVLLVGSAAEYGLVAPGQSPVGESHPLRPVSVYGLTKVMQTSLMTYYCAAFNLDIVLARTFNLKGRGLSPSLLPGRLDREIERLTRGEIELIEVGSLDGRRDFISVEDAAALYVRIADHGLRGETYNVASGEPIGLREYVGARLAEDGLPPTAFREGARHDFVGKSANVHEIWADVRKVHSLPG